MVLNLAIHKDHLERTESDSVAGGQSKVCLSDPMAAAALSPPDADVSSR